MLKKLMVTTALSGLMIGAAIAQSSAPADRPASSPPAATQSSPATPPAATPSSPSAATPSSPAMDSGKAATTGSAPSSSSSAQIINSQKPDQFLASKFKGTDVIGPDNEKIGDVTDILFDKNGKIEAFVVGVGGFLGMGAKEVALAPSSFQFAPGDKSKNESDKLKLSMTKDQLKQAANFEPYNPPRATTGMGSPGGGATRPAPASPPPAAR